MPSQMRCTSPEVELLQNLRRKARESITENTIHTSRLQKTLQCVVYDGTRRVDTYDIDLSNAIRDFCQVATHVHSKVLSDQWNEIDENERNQSNHDDLDSVLGTGSDVEDNNESFHDELETVRLPKAVEHVVFVVDPEAFDSDPSQAAEIHKAYPSLFNDGLGKIERKRTSLNIERQSSATSHQPRLMVSIPAKSDSLPTLGQFPDLSIAQLPTPVAVETASICGFDEDGYEAVDIDDDEHDAQYSEDVPKILPTTNTSSTKQVTMPTKAIAEVLGREQYSAEPATPISPSSTRPSLLDRMDSRIKGVAATADTIEDADFGNGKVIQPDVSRGPAVDCIVQAIAERIGLRIERPEYVQSMYRQWKDVGTVRAFNRKKMQLQHYYCNLVDLSIVGHETAIDYT